LTDLITLVREVVRRTRQHHAIEHATLHMLAARFPSKSFAGYSDPLGFTVYGDVDAAALRRAVGDGLLRLQAGEKRLALHPNCGTSLVATAILATVGGLIGGRGRASVWLRFPSALVMVVAALLAGKPFGLYLQRFTTLADVEDRWVLDIREQKVGKLRTHRVIFE
jgi:hypothetical protein